ncbi:MAG: hypothetical protein GF334_09415 [Candidatus Altiarchaeales archaeon]|nr:hypothetical protein [Candidatus Altiarchaeales archaeon]
MQRSATQAHDHSPSRPLVFLDIDGVLNHYRWWDYAAENMNRAYVEGDDLHRLSIDPVSVVWVNRLLTLSDGLLVISSTWRVSFPFEELKRILGMVGINQDLIIGRTPEYKNAQRGWEIEDWVEKFGPCVGYVALDDDSDWGDIEEHWCLIDRKVGFTEDDLEKALEILEL